ALYAGLPRWFDRVVPTDIDRIAHSDASLKSDGFEPATASFGTLEIAVDDGVDVFVNDQYLGTAPITPIRSKPAEYELLYKFDRTDLGREKVTVAAGQLSHNSIRSLLGSLELLVLPASNTVMQLDDKPAVPVSTHLMVRPGKHRLTFTAGGYQPQTVFVSVVPGKPHNVSVILQPVIIGSPPSPTFTSPPVQSAAQVQPG